MRVIGTIPVDPDAPDARQLLRDELGKAPYQAAKPTWFDEASKAFFDWLGSLVAPSGDGFEPWIPLILTVIVAVACVVCFLVFGVPRLNRRSDLRHSMFGDSDERSADAMRHAARTAAAAGTWDLACEEAFRAIARSLFERTILAPSPGTTATDFARRAAGAFPAHSNALVAAARTFDQIRYLGSPGTDADYRALVTLDGVLRDARPSLDTSSDTSVDLSSASGERHS
ncbi:DUF4129 domain-containing protein [Glaciibacter psychrotolerans]|uniref:Protein-glutamine gamma-glutamyltransferase-like C-terminal domain-containing protein n=1 Tax=Glaciibacter psychrotolerans TaxID=670054 RepID=A0A7Z0EFC6_9MICO|nr:DUF4129 domain-containing protein [Leifsonia psychrotolerans]NYJ20215.1 hypothetical protein [Leifsonia psychrotolerans]